MKDFSASIAYEIGCRYLQGINLDLYAIPHLIIISLSDQSGPRLLR